jgi:restriction system protein
MTKTAKGAEFVRFFGPLLNALRELGGSGTPDEVAERIAADLELPEEVQNELLTSGGLRYANQVAWARLYLAREGLVDRSKRGVWGLTERGVSTNLTAEQSRAIFHKWVKIDREKRRRDGLKSPSDLDVTGSATQFSDALEAGLQDHEDIIDGPNEEGWEWVMQRTLLRLSPGAFERLAQRMLRESGFTQVEVTGQTGDGGIDGKGIARINGFLSFQVLFQCKRYQGSVNVDQIRAFRGSMQGRTDKGLFITTGTFTRDAIKEATRDGAPPIDLIDGKALIQRLKELGLGVKVETVEAVSVDESWFSKI